MAKKDIGKILTTGTPKQRILLIAEDIARGKYFTDKLLTDHEFNQLSNSFKKPNEINLWNKWTRLDRTVTEAIMNLQGLKFEVLMHFSNLRGYILVWNTLETTELLVNSILHEIKDPKERINIGSQFNNQRDFLFTRIKTDKEGYLKIDIHHEEKNKYEDEIINLWAVMNTVKKQATESAIRFLSWKEAIIDYMEEEGFSIKTYKDVVNKLTEDIHKPIIGWNKYISDEKIFDPAILAKNRVDKLKDKYAITPNIKELEVDIEIYNDFKNKFLKHE